MGLVSFFYGLFWLFSSFGSVSGSLVTLIRAIISLLTGL